MYRIRTFLIIPLLAGIILLSCTPEACLEETESYLKATFYSSATKLAIRPDSLTAYGVGMNGNMIYSGQKQLSMARLPLNPVTGSSEFIIRINTFTDTIRVTYSSSPYLISKECGYSFKHNLSQILNSNVLIDSIWLINPQVTNENNENIRIFY